MMLVVGNRTHCQLGCQAVDESHCAKTRTWAVAPLSGNRKALAFDLSDKRFFQSTKAQVRGFLHALIDSTGLIPELNGKARNRQAT